MTPTSFYELLQNVNKHDSENIYQKVRQQNWINNKYKKNVFSHRFHTLNKTGADLTLKFRQEVVCCYFRRSSRRMSRHGRTGRGECGLLDVGTAALTLTAVSVIIPSEGRDVNHNPSSECIDMFNLNEM